MPNMRRIDKKKCIVGVLAAVALIVVVSGIGKFHANPFSLTLSTSNPTVLVMNPSGLPCAVADQTGSVLLLMNNNGKLRHTVKVNNADHPHDRITLLYVSGDSIYANVVTTENQHLVHEQIRLYNKSGRCLRSICERDYRDGKVFYPRNQLFIYDKGRLSVIRIEDNILKNISLGKDSAIVTDSVVLSEPVIEVKQGKDSSLYVSGLYGRMYEYVPGSGCVHPVRLSDEGYVDLVIDESSDVLSIAYSPIYAVANVLFWLSLLFVCVIAIFFAYRLFHDKYNKKIGVILAVVLLSAGIVAFYSYHIIRQTKTELTQMMLYQTDLIAYVTEHNYMGLTQTLSAENIDSCLMQPNIIEQLTDLHAILAKSSQYNGNEYYVAIVYNNDSIARQLVDNMNLASTGQPAYISPIQWDAPSTNGTDIINAFDEWVHYTIRNITDQTGRTVAKIISALPEHLLRSNQKDKALGLFLSLLSILIGVYTLFLFVSAIRRSLSEYIHRRRAALPYAKEQLFPTFHSLIIWFREVDRSLMVFIIPYFAVEGSIGDVASITAIVLMVYSMGSIVMIPFTKLAYARFSMRTVSVAAACVNLFSYILMVVALKSSEVNLFYIAKFLSGASAGNVLTVVSNSFGASVKDQADRARLFNEKQTVGNTINVLAILLSGYIIQYLSPVVLYVVAILLSALLICICAMAMSGSSRQTCQSANTTLHWRDMVKSFKFFLLRDGISVVWFVLLPMALLFGYLDFVFPLYASECGVSPLMLSNIIVIGLTLNLLLRTPLNKYYASIGTKRALTVQVAIISAALLVLVVSPNIIWMTVICLIIYVLKMNSCVILYQVEVIERNGFKQEEVQSDCILADQILRTVRMPFINMLVQAGRISASIWIGAICALLTGGLALLDRKKQ